MAPVAPSLAQSESKARFFNRIGLNEGNKMHRHLYTLMKGEAAEGWARMTASRDSLLPQFKNDSTIEPPYTFSMIEEAAVQREILRIFENARPDTKILYGLGRDNDGDSEQNWIIRWLLWHVFRYRDERNANSNRRAALSQSPRPDSAEADTLDAPPDPTEGQDPMIQVAAEASQSATNARGDLPSQEEDLRQEGDTGNTARYWDPVREEYRE